MSKPDGPPQPPSTDATGLVGRFTHPDQPLSFTFDGQAIPAVAGQSIAAALYAAGVRIFSRSFKYHRPRGLFCASGDCPNCLMQVDGRPNVRTCTEPVRQGMVVEHQNAWPSLECDALRVFDWFDRWLPVGFYYKHFHKPQWLWPIFESTVRHIAGLGWIDIHGQPSQDTTVEHLHPDVCIVGGGPAGLAAAAAAAGAGARVLILERLPGLGGHALFASSQALAEVEPLLAAIRQQPRVEVLCEATAFGHYEGNLVGAFQKDRLLKVRARQTIICTGGRQRAFLFPNNDLPGILLGNAVLRLARLEGVRAGRRAVVVTDNDDGHQLSEELRKLGIEVAALVDRRSESKHPHSVVGGTMILSSHAVVGARGNRCLKAVRVAHVDENGRVDERSERDIRCDLLCMASQLVPANELLHQAGVRFRFEAGRWIPDRPVAGILAAGAAAGTIGLTAQIAEGRCRGLEAAASLGHAVEPVSGTPPESSAGAAGDVSLAFGPGGPKCFVCLCEDVTVKDLEQAMAEGFDGIETLKRYSTANMGPCQGKVCGQTTVEVCARQTSRAMGAVGTTTSRPPVVPVEMAVVAADRRHHPVRRTALHAWHEIAGAHWLDAGLWKRPESYGDPLAEVEAVHTTVGLIDVSTLGKIELVGPDALELLERVCINRLADLRIGRIRHGVMCNEDGILFDDGVVCRLGPQHYYLTASTTNAEAVHQWLELWRTIWGLNVVLIVQTSANAAMNLAGPRAREVLARLTGMALSPSDFPFMAVRQGEVAGIPCHLLRIGFVGELGYEIHCPSSAAWHLWEAIHAAGAPFGLKPFGVEAQRVLRLEKGFPLIGHDTDALSNPLDAGMEKVIRFDKPIFNGRDALLRLREMPARQHLVGFVMLDTQQPPPEGCQVVADGAPVGRVTSARYSPTLNRSLGLAWVPAVSAGPGSRFLIRWNGVDVAAVVTALPFYDPEGTRVRA